MKLPFKFDPSNPEHLEWVESNIDNIDEETLKFIYNIVDVDIKNDCWNKFTSYNIKDVQLVDRLEDKMKLIELAITMAYDAKVNYMDIFFQVRMWDIIIYNYLKKRNIVIPQIKKTEKDAKYAGAYVKEPVPGLYDYVVSFDLNSLYPHLIMQYSISPETLVSMEIINNHIDKLKNDLNPKNEEELDALKKVKIISSEISVNKLLLKELDLEPLKKFNLTITANGALYRRVKGMLPELMEKMYNERVIFKKKMLVAKQQYEKTPTKTLEKEIARCNNIQMAKKISLNSAYGACGSPYFRYFKLANAEAITLSGQLSIRWIENKMNEYINHLLKTDNIDYVIASDTDSLVGETEVYINSEKIKIKDIYDNVCNSNNLICKRDKNDYIHDVSNLNLYTKSYDGEEIVNDKIIHIMKHKVKKKLYKITVNGNEVILTEDHSLVVERNNKLVSIKPQEVIEDDIFINITDTGGCLKTPYKSEKNEKEADN